MMHIIEAFACGIAFALGVNSWFFIRDLATAKGRTEIKKEMLNYWKRVEDRMAVQVETMLVCLEEIKKHNDTQQPTEHEKEQDHT